LTVAPAGRPEKVALLLALAAAFSSWNPVAAPFGLAVGVAAAVLSARAASRAEGRRRGLARAALALSVLAAAGSAVVLLLAAGVGRGAQDASPVPSRSPEEARGILDRQEAETAEARERARRELEGIPGEATRGAPGLEPGEPPRR
jgi:hypothetical protein